MNLMELVNFSEYKFLKKENFHPKTLIGCFWHQFKETSEEKLQIRIQFLLDKFY